MTRYQSQVIYGLFIGLTGGIIAFLSYQPSQVIQYILSMGMLFGAGFAFVTAAKNENADSALKYHGLQGAGMIAYGLAILIYAPTFEKFITVTMAFLVYFGITEILMGFQLMTGKRRISMPVVVMRMITGLFTAVGAVIILAMAFSNKNVSLLFAGILITVTGLNFILFANAIRKFARFV